MEDVYNYIVVHKNSGAIDFVSISKAFMPVLTDMLLDNLFDRLYKHTNNYVVVQVQKFDSPQRYLRIDSDTNLDTAIYDYYLKKAKIN